MERLREERRRLFRRSRQGRRVPLSFGVLLIALLAIVLLMLMVFSGCTA